MDQENCCENCIFSLDFGESVQFIKCQKTRKYVDKKNCCKHHAFFRVMSLEDKTIDE